MKWNENVYSLKKVTQWHYDIVFHINTIIIQPSFPFFFMPCTHASSCVNLGAMCITKYSWQLPTKCCSLQYSPLSTAGWVFLWGLPRCLSFGLSLAPWMLLRCMSFTSHDSPSLGEPGKMRLMLKHSQKSSVLDSETASPPVTLMWSWLYHTGQS